MRREHAVVAVAVHSGRRDQVREGLEELDGRERNRNGIVWVLAGNGVAIWALALLGVLEPLPETLTSPVGGLVLAAALFWNGRLSHRHECGDCGCPMH